MGAVHLLIRECAVPPAVKARQRHALSARRYRSSRVDVEHLHAFKQRWRAFADRRDHLRRRDFATHPPAAIAPDSREPRWSDDLMRRQETISDEIYQVKFSKHARAIQLQSYRFRWMQLAQVSDRLAIEQHSSSAPRMQKAILRFTGRLKLDARRHAQRDEPLFEHALERREASRHGWLSDGAQRIVAVAYRG